MRTLTVCLRPVIKILFLSASMSALADDSFYCPQNHAQINIGMTQEEVISACGEPISRKESDQPVTVKIPVMQLIYNVQGAQHAFYGVWSLPVGVDTGALLEVEVINNKVSNVQLNGEGTNAFSICDANMIQIGDPVNKVYSYCGNPSLVNNTFIKKPVQSEHQPQIWVYQADEYSPSFTLTFVDGKLLAISN